MFFIVLFMAGSVMLKGQTQMPNADFEGWSAAFPDNRPLNYNTVDTIGLHSCFKTTDKHGGTYAAKLRSLDTTIIIYNVKVPGVATLGRINLSSMTITKGIPFPNKPDNFRGYYKYLPVNVDTMSIYLYFWRYNAALQKQDTMGGVVFDTSATISSYTLFDLPIQWDTNYTGLPDSMNIILLASNTVQNHTSAFFDDFSFYYLATGFEQRLDDVLTEVYPNPAKDLITINNEIATEISLYTISGALILKREAAEKNYQLDVSGLPRGIYILKLQNDSRMRISKIILE